MNGTTTAPRLALLQPPRTGTAIRVCGMSLRDRWQAGLGRGGYQVRTLPEPGGASILESATTPVLVADGGAILDPDAMARLVAATCDDDEVVQFRDVSGRMAPAILLGASAARRLSASGDGVEKLRRAIVAGAPYRLADLYGESYPEPPDRKSANAVSRAMLARMRLRPGGLVARHVNRHVSIRLSYWLLKTPITPNQITTVTGVLGLVSAAVLLHPGYLWGLLGAAIMQFSSIVDGCDGEVARLRYQQSEFGKWYDSAWDEVVNALFIVAVGVHVSAIFPDPPWADLALWSGVFAGVVNYVYGMLNFHCKWVTGIGLYWWFDRPPVPRPADAPPVQPTLWSEFKTVFGRDAYLLAFFVAALLYLLPLMLAMIVAASVVFFVLLFLHVFVMKGRW